MTGTTQELSIGLVRQGPGNEDERLALLRGHQQQVIGRIAELTESLDLITHKVAVYEEHLSQGTARDLWSTPQEGGCEAMPARSRTCRPGS